ncbi:MAG: 4-hydroxy-tetrahydrodipicolinate synthase [Bacteroidales bacterium]|mgnify:FL=1|jgi:4-hydroxy-tetrahydrodipicolinate synthase|nr:4-hydroxy-tetrahydrodipicolinate synthase [Bacteroidales bacterium]MDI9591862.1 4-hydroxy-tetrahydrodipicolinate synthase [Bacteroidota bacterium]MBP7874684.1 4-hydroxy-tetrahydrodipicolinate synthase [Bacteroidales bacterium]MCO6468070.1 4-hydroxy-tetrahydrodipicolinate synthase [Bacteroidales bacterium]MCZ2282109.1 4-hydroxy-tetrahydrodipicolinate synthase [Bacteroidales bacterium]
MKFNFTGTGVALVTPFHKNGNIDFCSLEKVVEHTIAGNVDYLVALGTTGETPTLSNDEKLAVVDFVIECAAGRVPVVVGVGGNNTQEIIDKIKTMSFEGIAGILSVSPYYNKPQQKGIYYHYKTVSSVCPVPMILYNVPGRTGANMSAETTLQLASECDNVVAVKEASGNVNQIMEIIRCKPDNFHVISGDDAITLPLISLGANGVISVVANAFPSDFSKMVNLCLKGKFAEANVIHYKLLPIMQKIFEDGSPAGIKAALQILEIAANNLRLPLVKVNKAVNLQLQQLIAEYQN